MRQRPAEPGQHPVADYDQVIRLAPSMQEAYLNRGVARFHLQRYDGALADFAEAIRRRPTDPDAYENRATCREAAGDRAAGATLAGAGLAPAGHEYRFTAH